MRWFCDTTPCVESLSRYERAYRVHLEDDPADMQCRVDLAWCLFMMSLYQAGRESTGDSDCSVGELSRFDHTALLKGRRAPALLQDCLRQTIIVSHLSRDPSNREDVSSLRRLVKVSGGEAALREADDESDRILSEIVREIDRTARPNMVLRTVPQES